MVKSLLKHNPRVKMCYSKEVLRKALMVAIRGGSVYCSLPRWLLADDVEILYGSGACWSASSANRMFFVSFSDVGCHVPDQQRSVYNPSLPAPNHSWSWFYVSPHFESQTKSGSHLFCSFAHRISRHHNTHALSFFFFLFTNPAHNVGIISCVISTRRQTTKADFIPTRIVVIFHWYTKDGSPQGALGIYFVCW